MLLSNESPGRDSGGNFGPGKANSELKLLPAGFLFMAQIDSFIFIGPMIAERG
jgi:hypothetical protein